MGENRGKQFEGTVRDCFERAEFCIDRLYDQTNGFKGSQNICDFVVFRQPNIMYLECKSCHGNTFPLSNITQTQWNGLLEKDLFQGVYAGVMIWWIDKDITKFLPIYNLQMLADSGAKSIRFDTEFGIDVPGKKKRVFFEYDMEKFWEELKNEYGT